MADGADGHKRTVHYFWCVVLVYIVENFSAFFLPDFPSLKVDSSSLCYYFLHLQCVMRIMTLANYIWEFLLSCLCKNIWMPFLPRFYNVHINSRRCRSPSAIGDWQSDVCVTVTKKLRLRQAPFAWIPTVKISPPTNRGSFPQL